MNLAHQTALLLYFGTFALLASLWLTYHRLMSGTYRPGGIDVTLAFTYLAFVSLMPYAMYALSHEDGTRRYDDVAKSAARLVVRR